LLGDDEPQWAMFGVAGDEFGGGVPKYRTDEHHVTRHP